MADGQDIHSRYLYCIVACDFAHAVPVMPQHQLSDLRGVTATPDAMKLAWHSKPQGEEIFVVFCSCAVSCEVQELYCLCGVLL